MQRMGGNPMAGRTQKMGVNPGTEVPRSHALTSTKQEQALEVHTPARVKRVVQGMFSGDWVMGQT